MFLLRYLLTLLFIVVVLFCGSKHELSDQTAFYHVAAIFTSVHTKILIPECIGCHSGKEAPHGIDLSSYSSIVESSVFPPLVVPGDPNASSLFLSVVDDEMPIRKISLSFRQKLALFEWIKLGVLEVVDDEGNGGGGGEGGDAEEPPPPESEPDEPCD